MTSFPINRKTFLQILREYQAYEEKISIEDVSYCSRIEQLNQLEKFIKLEKELLIEELTSIGHIDNTQIISYLFPSKKDLEYYAKKPYKYPNMENDKQIFIPELSIQGQVQVYDGYEYQRSELYNYKINLEMFDLIQFNPKMEYAEITLRKSNIEITNISLLYCDSEIEYFKKKKNKIQFFQ